MPRRIALLAGVALIAAGASHPARAIETTVGDWQVNIDTTLTTSTDIRASSVAHQFIGYSNHGTYPLPNADNGDLNFAKGGFVDAPQRVTTEVQVKKDDYGFFVRATGFWDPIINTGNIGFETKDMNGDPVWNGLSHAAQKDVGTDLRLLDAYVFARPDIGDHPIDVRVGNQALNWGESTFIQFGINSITPLDLTALHQTGAELRTAFLPIPVVDLKTDITEDVNIEGFWQPYWTRYKVDPVGSFFSTNDTLTDGGKYGMLSVDVADTPNAIHYVNSSVNDLLGAALPRLLDRHPTGVGEGGVAIRTTVDWFGGTELGGYFENYDSRIPFGSYRTGSPNIGKQFIIGGPGTEVLPAPSTLYFPGTGIPGYATSNYTATAGFRADYPSDIQLIGASFNLTGPAGIAIQGEVSDRLNQPIQLAASDLALAMEAPALKALQPFAHVLASLGGAYAVAGDKVIAAYDQALADPVIAMIGGIPDFNRDIQGWKRYNVTQFQSTFTKLWGAQPDMDINQIALIGEIGGDYVNGFPKQSGVFNANYTTDTSSAFAPAASVNPNGALSHEGFATPFSMGSVMALQVDMPNLLPYGIGFKPTLSVGYDFAGTSPYGVNVFQVNTGSVSIGTTFTYLNQWTANIGYTNHFVAGGSDQYDGLIDRDFVSMSVSYLF